MAIHSRFLVFYVHRYDRLVMVYGYSSRLKAFKAQVTTVHSYDLHHKELAFRPDMLPLTFVRENLMPGCCAEEHLSLSAFLRQRDVIA
jgi:hypothetical protein